MSNIELIMILKRIEAKVSSSHTKLLKLIYIETKISSLQTGIIKLKS